MKYSLFLAVLEKQTPRARAAASANKRLRARAGLRRSSSWFAAACAVLLAGSSAEAANTEDDYIGSNTGSLATGTNWSLLTVPTAANDAVFPAYATTGIRNFGTGTAPTVTSLTFGSLNDLSLGTTVTLRNDATAASAVTLTLGGAGNLGNSVSGTAADLFYVATGGTFNITGVGTNATSLLNLALGQSGNFNVAGTSTISSIISDGGSGYAITKTGAGTLTLSGANTFSGGLNLNAGTVSIAAVNNLGSGTVSFVGGTLAITATVDPSAQFSQAANQAYNFSNSAAVTFTTALTSSGGTLNKAGASTLTSTAANTFSGATTVAGGSIALLGVGSLASTTINLQSSTAGGGLTLTNTGAGNNAVNRVGDTATINLGGGSFVIGGSDQATTNVSETVGSFVLSAGVSSGNTNNVITVTPGTGGSTTLTTGTITRAAGSTMALVNGTGLGSSTTSTSQFFATTAPTLIGTTAPSASGSTTNKTTQIVPGLVGESTTTAGGAGTVTGTANTFLTYTATGGFRPLNPTDEFTQNVVTSAANVRTTAATSMTANTSVNSLVINGSTLAANTLTLSTGTTLTNTSGMLLFAPTANVASSITGGTVAFGTTEGLVYAGGTVGTNQTIASAVTGSNGIAVSGPGNVVLSGAITLSGGTLANTQHFLTLSNTGNNFAGASIVTSAGSGGILFNQAFAAFNGATSVTAINGSQIRFNGAANTGTFSSVPMVLGDSTTSGNIYMQRNGDAADWTFPGQVTAAGPNPSVIQGFNAGNNSYIFSGGITGNGAGGLELQANGGNVAYFDRITLGGTLNYTGPTYLSNDSNLRVALNATTLPTTTVLNFRAATASRTAQFDLNGNNQTVAGLQSLGTSGVAQVINSSATASTFTVNNSTNYVFAGNLGTVGVVNSGGTVTNTTGGSTQTVILATGTANNFSLVKTGAGTLTLTGASSYTGGTTINGGMLLVGSITPVTGSSVLGTGNVTIGTGANAGALGTFAGAVTLSTLVTTSGTGSVIAPGATGTTTNGAVGTLMLSGGLNVANGATIPFDLASTSALSDKISVTGGTFTSATGTGSGSVTFAFNNLGVPTGSATTYALITYTGATAADVDLSDFSSTGVAGSFMFNGTELDFVTAVPEPSTWISGLFCVGLAGRVIRRRIGARGRAAR